MNSSLPDASPHRWRVKLDATGRPFFYDSLSEHVPTWSRGAPRRGNVSLVLHDVEAAACVDRVAASDSRKLIKESALLGVALVEVRYWCNLSTFAFEDPTAPRYALAARTGAIWMERKRWVSTRKAVSLAGRGTGGLMASDAGAVDSVVPFNLRQSLQARFFRWRAAYKKRLQPERPVHSG